ncbi:MAG: divalent-cation tolerance protein CutA [Acidobacteriota bacterium]|jgi:periplasmic divalent cation tolerance protein|nr:divalent-cation tolerance protein CutA [Acidobacteriota bacterium]
MDAIIVLSTVGSEELGVEIAAALVENGEAACVNILPGIRSVYRWKGELCRDAEHLLIIKSVQGKFDAVRERIRSLHPYEVPEVLAIPVAAGDADYLQWLRLAVGATL